MVMLVSLAQASRHLRRDTSDDDADLTLKIKAASAVVMGLLGSAATFLDSEGNVPMADEPGIADSDGELLDSNGDEIADGDEIPVGVPEHVQQATLLLIGDYYAGRDSGSAGFPPAVMALLNIAGRVPSLA